MKTFSFILLFILYAPVMPAQDINWPTVTTDSKPAARWWWMGSAVDKANLTRNLETYAKAGMGTMEITPIYGVQGNERNEISFLTPRWMEMLQHTEKEAKRLNMLIDMNTGTGWPFGGPEVTVADAASKLIVREYQVDSGQRLPEKIEALESDMKSLPVLSRLMAFSDQGKCIDLTGKVKDGVINWKAPKGEWRVIAAFCGKTLQKVKRAAPGGEGLVMDHLSHRAVKNYLNRFENAFRSTGTAYPHNFFNDSYEVYKADWTEDFFDQFAARRGYKLEEYLPDFLSDERTDRKARIITDYRETFGELLLENFTRQWTDWAHSHGTLTRNQAHGSPGNLIDLYATVDIPECEGFGLSDFGIKGLRKDSLTRPNDSDLSILKYASSAAHIAGKPYTSSETFTWLTEHFRTSLSQCKPDLDLLFLSGVNHTYIHGTTYSPAEAAWPGWKFYASIDMSPTNSIWQDVPGFFSYITRCQSFLQYGKPNADFLVYLPVYDLWHKQGGRLLMFDIHKMDKRAPRFIDAIHKISNAGYDVDYISDNFIRTAAFADGKIQTIGGSAYKGLIVPGARFMPHDVLEKLAMLASQGANIVFVEQYPEDVPGLADLENRRREFSRSLDVIKNNTSHVFFGTDYSRTLELTGVLPETMKSEHGLSFIRRANETGHHYFISALQHTDTQAWIRLSVPVASAMFFDPMTGKSGKARIRTNNGFTEVFVQLGSGESVILKTFAQNDVQASAWEYLEPASEGFDLTGNWEFYFKGEQADKPLLLESPVSWTELSLPDARSFTGTGVYRTEFVMNASTSNTEWVIDLGDVRESARLRVNGKEVAILWAVPFRHPIGNYLKQGKNTIEIEVTNLPANRISDMDRRNIPWRKFKEINMVDINYKKSDYSNWEPMPSGLSGPVKIIPMKRI